MAESKNVLSEILNEIAQENNMVNPKIAICDAVRGGYLGIPSTITIEESGNGSGHDPLHLFLKVAPKNSRENFYIRDLYINEIVMYENVLPEFLKFQKEKNVREPFQSFVKCYRISSIDGNEFLIMEDLTKKDFVVWDKTKPMTPKGVEFILKEMAKYHALSFALRDQKPDVFGDLTRKLSADINIKTFGRFEGSFRANAKCALNLFDPVKDKKIYKALDSFAENELKAIVLESSISDNDKAVIIHGDSWCNNFMLKFEDPSDPDSLTQMKFLDWQCSRLSSPVIDMSYFIYGSGPQEVFDDLDHYLKVYHNTLASSLTELGTDVEKVFPLSALQDHWRKYAKYGLTMACSVINTFYNPNHAEAQDMAEIAKDDEDIIKNFSSIDVINKEMYRNRVGGVVTHFVNKGFI